VAQSTFPTSGKRQGMRLGRERIAVQKARAATNQEKIPKEGEVSEHLLQEEQNLHLTLKNQMASQNQFVMFHKSLT